MTGQSKARCERQVPYVRSRFFAGEDFVDLADANRRAVTWCREGAGQRNHGTTRAKPAEAFRAAEQALLLVAPSSPYDTPLSAEPKVHPDHHVEVARGLYSIPGLDMVGKKVWARVDSATAKFYFHGQLLKVHPRVAPGGRSTDPADLPSEKTVYAMRDINHLTALGKKEGQAIGAYLEALLAGPLPWTKMRQAYRLLGLVKKWGPERVEAACQKALDAEAVNVNLIARMIDRALEAEGPVPVAPKVLSVGRFSRHASEFSARAKP